MLCFIWLEAKIKNTVMITSLIRPVSRNASQTPNTHKQWNTFMLVWYAPSADTVLKTILFFYIYLPYHSTKITQGAIGVVDKMNCFALIFMKKKLCWQHFSIFFAFGIKNEHILSNKPSSTYKKSHIECTWLYTHHE